MSPKTIRKISCPELEISQYLCNLSKESKSTNRLTDIQEISNNLEIVQKYPGNVTKKFQKDISSRTGDIPILSLISVKKYAN